MIRKVHPGAFDCPALNQAGATSETGAASVLTHVGPSLQMMFEPTPAELAALNAGGFVMITAFGPYCPALNADVWTPPAREDDDVENVD